MKFTSLLTSLVLAGTLTTAATASFLSQASADTMKKPDAMSNTMAKPDPMKKDTMAKPDAMKKDAMALSPSQKIAKLSEVKGKKGSADLMRSYFAGDLEPIGMQPGGAGMVVNFYNKAGNITVSYCSTFDVIVAVKSGKIAKFAPSEVK
jgi:pentapeptide MXKDX repeat protein